MTSTADAIMDVAQDLLQTRGYHAFSYRDIASAIGIRTASIHYHFPTKELLAQAIAQRVFENFRAAAGAIAATTQSAPEKLRGFARIFRTTFGDGDRLCPICMLAVGQDAISDAISESVREFWLWTEAWLTQVLEEGAQARELRLIAAPTVVAKTWLAALEGTMITARAFREPARLEEVVRYLLALVETVSDAH